MNGQAKDLSDRNTFLTCCAGERGVGLEENLRLFSLIPANSRLSPLNGRKKFEAPAVVSICNTVPMFLCCSGAPGTIRNANLYGGESP